MKIRKPIIKWLVWTLAFFLATAGLAQGAAAEERAHRFLALLVGLLCLDEGLEHRRVDEIDTVPPGT